MSYIKIQQQIITHLIEKKNRISAEEFDVDIFSCINIFLKDSLESFLQ